MSGFQQAGPNPFLIQLLQAYLSNVQNPIAPFLNAPVVQPDWRYDGGGTEYVNRAPQDGDVVGMYAGGYRNYGQQGQQLEDYYKSLGGVVPRAPETPPARVPGMVTPEAPPTRAPAFKPNLMQPIATQVAQPNPADRVLGGPAGMNPWMPKRMR